MNTFELFIIFCVFITGIIICKMIKSIFRCIFKNKKLIKVCGRYTNVVKCEEFPSCGDCPYKVDRV